MTEAKLLIEKDIKEEEKSKMNCTPQKFINDQFNYQYDNSTKIPSFKQNQKEIHHIHNQNEEKLSMKDDFIKESANFEEGMKSNLISIKKTSNNEPRKVFEILKFKPSN